jgi:hypothetical protein
MLGYFGIVSPDKTDWFRWQHFKVPNMGSFLNLIKVPIIQVPNLERSQAWNLNYISLLQFD